MNFKIKKLLFALTFSMMTSAVHAADGTINFQGKVTTAGCVIENPDMILEGYRNLARWPVAEVRAYFMGPVASTINIDCGDLSSIPKVRFIPETGKVVGKQRNYLGVTGTASNVAFRIGISTDKVNETLAFDDKLYDLSVPDAAHEKYRFVLNHTMVGLSPYDESNNGDFEAVLGYDLVYN